MTAFFTFAYNASATLRRTVESVLNQTCREWVYYLCDDGSTLDNTREIIREYAQKDSRIIPIYMDNNDPYEASRIGFSKIFASDADFFCMIDADDEYDSKFLEKSLNFMHEASLDIVASGSDFIDAQHLSRLGERKAGRKIVLHDGKSYSDFFPVSYQFMRTIWGKLYKVSLFQNFDYCSEGWEYYKVAYGGDTIFFMKAAAYANRIGILDESLHKYYISPKSSSHNWNPQRPDADRALYDYAISFLIAKAGFVSAQNRQFLQIVYANAVSDTLRVIGGSGLTPAEKLREYAGIAACPITLAAYRQNKDDSVTRSRSLLLQMALNAGLELKGQSDDNLRTVVQTLLPRCGPAVTGQNLPLIVRDQSLLQPFLADEPEPVLRRLLRLIAEKYGVKKYNLVEMVQTLAAGNPLLSRITDTSFLRRYGDIYLSAWRGEYYEMLEEMSGLLLDGQVSGGKKAFLELYISLAAALSQESAFIFGKLQLAALLLKQGDLPACRAVVADLEEMGLTDNEELDAIRYNLEKQT